jgi:hypothetical protein
MDPRCRGRVDAGKTGVEGLGAAHRCLVGESAADTKAMPSGPWSPESTTLGANAKVRANKKLGGGVRKYHRSHITPLSHDTGWREGRSLHIDEVVTNGRELSDAGSELRDLLTLNLAVSKDPVDEQLVSCCTVVLEFDRVPLKKFTHSGSIIR